jgi:hypothetical protein
MNIYCRWNKTRYHHKTTRQLGPDRGSGELGGPQMSCRCDVGCGDSWCVPLIWRGAWRQNSSRANF